MNKAGYILVFTLGAAAGSLLTWKIVEEKYKQITNEEIESIKKHYKKKEEITTAGYCEIVDPNIDVIEYKNHVLDLAYSSTEDVHEVYVEPGVDYIEPYVISPDEFGEKDYKTENWTYYSDLVLANEDDEVVTDYERIIGDALNHFGDYEDDSVFVRNENIECDYEILKDERTFSEVVGEE